MYRGQYQTPCDPVEVKNWKNWVRVAPRKKILQVELLCEGPWKVRQRDSERK